MIKRSTYKLTEDINIDEVIGNEANVSIIDLSSEREIKNEDSEGNTTITYEYDGVEARCVNDINYIRNNKDHIYAKAMAREKSKIGDVSVAQRLEALEEAVLELAGE